MNVPPGEVCPKRVAIVGAGASGIPAAKEALEHGLEPVVFEMSDDIGGLWRYKPEETDEGSVMKTTVINTSKEMTAYSTFPPPSHFANFMHNRRMLDYLRLFAASFDFQRHLRLRHTVLDVRRAPSYDADGKWSVKYKNGESLEFEELFDAVLLCTGHHTRTHWPRAWPGQAHFQGRIIHAHSYKDHHGFDDQTVVVVGVGNSGVDIAVELSRIAAEVHLATRRGTWVLHRNLDHSVPFDMALNTRLLFLLQRVVPHKLTAWYFQKSFERRFDHDKFGLRPQHGVLSAHLTVNDELPNRLSCGTVRIRPNIRQFTRKGVVFEDGVELAEVDQVILATGYSFEFPLLEGGRLIPVEENDVSLYLNMFPTALHAHNTLAVVGLIQPLGSIMPIAEMQARLFFGAFVGRVALPDAQAMEADVREKRAQMAARYVQSRRHTIQAPLGRGRIGHFPRNCPFPVDYVEYMDQLAALIGCVPPLGTYALTDFPLFKELLFGPNTPYVYRLSGPGTWDGAREAILGANDRTKAGMRGIELQGQGVSSGGGAKSGTRKRALPSELIGALCAFVASLVALALTVWASSL